MSVEIKEAYDHIESIRMLFEEYTASLGIDLSYQSYAAELSGLPGKYAHPDGRLYIAHCGNIPAGCVALRPIGADTREIKRLYVRSQFRGLHLGRSLAQRVISEARDMACRRVVLDTLSSMERAAALYHSLGFTETAPYYDSPVPGTRFFQLLL